MTCAYDPASGAYTSVIPSGTTALRRYIQKRWGVSTQVIRDKSRCNKTKSEHCECRAIDAMTGNKTIRRAIFDWVVKVHEELQLQSVIADRRVFGFGRCVERHYSGPSPHTDHAHVGLTKWAARNLTEELIRKADGQEDEVTAEDLKKIGDLIDAKLKPLREEVAVLKKSLTDLATVVGPLYKSANGTPLTVTKSLIRQTANEGFKEHLDLIHLDTDAIRKKLGA